jgi:RNA polymerase sigma factor (sigma-70 family)
MTVARTSSVLRQMSTVFQGGPVAGLSDAQLLERFVARSGEAADAAFTALVVRHGPMVLGVCRRVLDDPNDVDDAFQATFLILVHKASAVRVDDSLGRWLYGVSCRVAHRARAITQSRRRREDSGVEPWHEPDSESEGFDWKSVLDEELTRLPEKYRAPIVLCYLQGLSHDKAAAQLGWPVGTVRGRMARARDLLRDRLTRRGLAPTAGVFLAFSALGEVRVAVPRTLVAATVRAALPHAAGVAGTSGVSAPVVALMQGVLKTMLSTKLQFAAASLIGAAASMAIAVAMSQALAAPAPGAFTGVPRPSAESPSEDPLRRALREALAATDAIANDATKALALLRIGSGQAQAGDTQEALSTFALARTSARAVPDAERKCDLLRKIAVAIGKAGDRSAATELLTHVTESSRSMVAASRIRTLNRVAEAHSELGDHDKTVVALKAAFELCEDAESLSDVKRFLIRAQLAQADVDGAMETLTAYPANLRDKRQIVNQPTLHLMVFEAPSAPPAVAKEALARTVVLAETMESPESGALGVILNQLAEAQANAGDLDGALATVHNAAGRTLMNARGMAPWTMASIAVRQAKAGDKDAARVTIQEALAIVRDPQNDDPHGDNRLRAIAEAQAQIGDLDEAIQTADTIRHDHQEIAHALIAIGSARMKAGQKDAARETFQRAAEEARAILPRENFANDDPATNTAHTLLMIARAQSDVGEFGPAFENASAIGPADWKFPLLADITTLLAKSGDFKGALARIPSLERDELKSETYAGIAAAQAASGDEAGALGWIAELPTPALKARALLGVSEGKARTKNAAAATPKP